MSLGMPIASNFLACLGRKAIKVIILTIALSSALPVEPQPSFASVLISVNKNTQQMSISVDGMTRYEFAVSTGRAGYGTPNGTYHPQWMAKSWFSKEYYNSPMPHSIFFHRGYAIHGSYEITRLGGPASHGCIRLHPENAEKLFSLVQQQGMRSTTIVVYGTNPTTARAQRVEPAYESQRPIEFQPSSPYFPLFRNPAESFDPGRIY